MMNPWPPIEMKLAIREERVRQAELIGWLYQDLPPRPTPREAPAAALIGLAARLAPPPGGAGADGRRMTGAARTR